MAMAAMSSSYRVCATFILRSSGHRRRIARIPPTAKSMVRSLRSVSSSGVSFSALISVMRVKSRRDSMSSGELCGPASSARWLSLVRCSGEFRAALMRLLQCSRTASSFMTGVPSSSMVSSTSWAIEVFSTSRRMAASASSARLPKW